jgi:5-methyltetrahydropteroyltriglutamate--homocysteine methyltransferase
MGPLDELRVDSVGSLLRPPELQDAFARSAAGEITDDELRRVQDAAVEHVVREQERIGFPVIVDGESRRTLFMESFGEIAGFEAWSRGWKRALAVVGERDESDHGADPVIAARIPVDGPLRLERSRPLDEYLSAQALTDRPVKVTLIGPDRIIQAYEEEASRSVYPDADAFLTDVVAVGREIVSGLADAGCRYVQVDAPGYTAYVDRRSLEDMTARGVDSRAQMRRTMAAENALIEGFADVTFGIHVCRGNRQSRWHREGAYDVIAEELFNGLAHKRLLLEYDTERAGTFAPLRFVPKGKIVVLGLVTTKTGRVETVGELVRRIEEATRYLSVEQLAISPQCGFASVLAGNRLTEDEQWRKLEIVLETAEAVWGR